MRSVSWPCERKVRAGCCLVIRFKGVYEDASPAKLALSCGLALWRAPGEGLQEWSLGS